jgi:hypothetical protein
MKRLNIPAFFATSSCLIASTAGAAVTTTNVCSSTSLDSLGEISFTVDMNHDGILDQVARADSEGAFPGVPGVSVTLGLRDGGHGATVFYPVPSDESSDMRVGDLDGDGNVDVVVALGYDNDGLSVFFGKGDGTLTPTPQTFSDILLSTEPSAAFSNGAETVGIGDFDGDGAVDLVSFNIDDGTISFYRNLGGRHFATHVVGSPNGLFAEEPTFFVVADVDRDGKLDLFTGGAFFHGNGDGTFRPSQACSK